MNDARTFCAWPTCRIAPLPGRSYCRQHHAAKERAMDELRIGRLDRLPPYAGAFIAVISTGFVSRLVVTTDPIRRRDELQAGSPYDLDLSSLVAANRSLLNYVCWAVDAGMAITRTPECAPRLRPGWYPVPPSDIATEMFDVIDETDDMRSRFMDLPDLLAMDIDLLDPAQRRVDDLLRLMGART